jgi:biopolymer transport protein ExbD
MSKFRLIAMAVLAVLMAAYGIYWLTYSSRPVTVEPAVITASVTESGAFMLEGDRITDAVALKAKLAKLRRAHPGAKFEVRATQGMPVAAFGKALQLLQQSGEGSTEITLERKKDANSE